ncbi:VOC family protein [Ancylobacter sp. 6x-1]|uniref:VOC family protein n=1 Tax=Ancylobacter crimeensis TaxID=2579147 RepID=A0ABT0DA24_9HYPH|nr:VOC family protein [Ancylobacter crimeensis]MCK0196790.1 VOC family protein [Ancylobacter crimeensis]
MGAKNAITPYLWFDGNAEEAVRFYCSVFPNARITGMSHYAEHDGQSPRRVMGINLELDGQSFGAINGGPIFQMSEATSFLIDCATQAEIDHYWETLGEGGTEQPCGWLKDRYGTVWQVNAMHIVERLVGADAATTGRVMKAMGSMRRIDLAALERAFEG